MKFLYIEIIFAVLISFVYCDCHNFRASLDSDYKVYKCVENSKGQIINLDIYLEYYNQTSFEKIGALTSLTQLKIDSNFDPHYDVDLTPLKKLKNLVEFSIDGGYDFYDQDKNQLVKSCFSKFKKLKKLFLGDWELSDEVLKDITSLQKLEHLIFDGNLKNSYVKAFSSLSSLNTFDVYIRPLDEEIDLSPFKSLENLENMSFECRVHKVRSTHYSFADKSFSELTQLKKLNLYGFTFDNYTAEDMSNMSSIEEIEFRRCSYSYVDASSFEPFKKLHNLKTLIFSGYYYFKSRALKEFPEVTSLTNLKKLVVTNSLIAKIPETIGNLKSLEYLDLSIGDLTELPDSLANLKKLKYLDLSGNDIVSLPEVIPKMSKLEYLNLSGNDLVSFPEGISKMSKLQNLDLSNNNLKTLPSDINKLKKLSILDLSSNSGEITNIELIKSLKKLKSLNLSGNELPSSFDSWIKNISSLETLNLRYTGLTSFPSSIVNLKKLTNLDLTYNSIVELPSSIKKLTKLSTLDLTSNGIVSIPSNIKYLKNLTYLYLDSNRITEIPDVIGDLSNLKFLSLYSNAITSIPSSFSNLENLETLKLRENKISELPSVFGKMENLKVIDLSYNSFTSYPLAICEIPSLSELTLDLNYNTFSEEIPECYEQIFELSAYF